MTLLTNDAEDCVNGDETYTGDLSISARGAPCLNWQKYWLNNDRLFTLEDFPDTSWEALGNKCRLFKNK